MLTIGKADSTPSTSPPKMAGWSLEACIGSKQRAVPGDGRQW